MYAGEGVYVQEVLGRPCVYRVDNLAFQPRHLRIWRDNPHYTRFEMSVQNFERDLLGIVAAKVNVLDPHAFARNGDAS